MPLGCAIVLGITGLLCARAQDRDRIAPRSGSGSVSIAWGILDEGLSDSSERHRQQIVLAGGSIGPTREAVRFVAGALHDKSTLVRQTAAAVLGEVKSSESIPYLQRALDDNAEVSFTAARSLCDLGDATGCSFLQDVLTGDRKDPKGGFVAKNLHYAKKKLTPAELAMMGVREASGVLLGPASIGIVAGEEIVRAETGSKGGGESGRAIAAAVLADHPDDYTRTLLEWALSDPHTSVRAAAAKGLGKCGSAESVNKLRAALNDPHIAVRSMAAAAIIRLSNAE
jgi:HEAT repeat protein